MPKKKYLTLADRRALMVRFQRLCMRQPGCTCCRYASGACEKNYLEWCADDIRHVTAALVGAVENE